MIEGREPLHTSVTVDRQDGRSRLRRHHLGACRHETGGASCEMHMMRLTKLSNLRMCSLKSGSQSSGDIALVLVVSVLNSAKQIPVQACSSLVRPVKLQQYVEIAFSFGRSDAASRFDNTRGQRVTLSLAMSQAQDAIFGFQSFRHGSPHTGRGERRDNASNARDFTISAPYLQRQLFTV